MLADDAHEAATSLIREIAKRLTAVIDEEAEAHESVCSLMMSMTFDPGSSEVDPGKLVESLQYFDRLQQRVAALCELIQNLTAAIDLGDDPAPVAQAFCATAPVAQDAEWLSELAQDMCTARPVDAAHCETWTDSDVTQTF